MNHITEFIIAYGALILFLAGFAEQSGLPFPGSLFVIASGALAANGHFNLFAVIGWTALGCIVADAILFLLGRRGRARVIGVFPWLQAVQVKLDRATLARNILHGLRMLTLAKFVPLGQVVAMHAGALQVNRLRFLLVDAFSSIVYATVFASLGFAFHNQLEQLAAFLHRLGTASWIMLAIIAGAYGAYRFIKRRQNTPPQHPFSADHNRRND
jgi:membrane-associated protein